MKVKDLIKKLETVNPNMEVYCTSNSGVYEYGVVHTASPKSITIVDGDGFIGDNPKEKTVFVLDEQ
jgi:hypothetical protein